MHIVPAKYQDMKLEFWEKGVGSLVEFFQYEIGDIILRFVGEGVTLVHSLLDSQAFGVGCLNLVDVLPLVEEAAIVQVELDGFFEVEVDLIDDGVDEVLKADFGDGAGAYFPIPCFRH